MIVVPVSAHGHGHNRVTVCCIRCLFVFAAFPVRPGIPTPPTSLAPQLSFDLTSPSFAMLPLLQQSLCNILFSIRI